jgi:hypothetical protein
VSVALGIPHAVRMRRVVTCGLSGPYYIFPQHFKNGKIFEQENVTERRICFWICSTILSATFLTIRRIQRDMIKIYAGRHAMYPLFLLDFKEIRIFSTDFRIILKYKISLKSVQGKQSCSTWTDGRTERHYESNSRFSLFL